MKSLFQLARYPFVLSSFFKCFCVFVFLNAGLLSRSLLLIVRTNPSSSTSKRRSGIALSRRPGCEDTWACQDTEETHGMFEDLAARVKLDEEEATQIKKE